MIHCVNYCSDAISFGWNQLKKVNVTKAVKTTLVCFGLFSSTNRELNAQERIPLLSRLNQSANSHSVIPHNSSLQSRFPQFEKPEVFRILAVEEESSDSDTEPLEAPQNTLVIYSLAPKNLIAEAFQSEVVLSSCSDPKPVIATYGAGPCVIIGGYEPRQKIGFIAHISHGGEVAEYGHKMIHTLSRYVDQKSKFKIVLKGGIESNPDSWKTFAEIAHWIRTTNETQKKIELEVVQIDPLKSENDPSKSLLIDTRDGLHREYDPLRDNPVHYRRLTMKDILHAQQSYEVRPRLRIAHPTDLVIE